MSKVPSLSYTQVIAAFKRGGFDFVSQRGSHIKLEKNTPEGPIRIIVPAHKPIKRSTLSHIIKSAGFTLDQFLELL